MRRSPGSVVGVLLVLPSPATSAGQTVLDPGCGPGTGLGVLTGAVTAAGAVIGVDHIQAMVEAARARTADQFVVDVRPGDVHALALPGGSGASPAAESAEAGRILHAPAPRVDGWPLRDLVTCPLRRILINSPGCGSVNRMSLPVLDSTDWEADA